MKKAKVSLIITIIMLLGIIVTTIVSYANNQDSIYVNLTKADASGLGYGIGNPTEGVSDETSYIWNINTYTNIDGDTLTELERNLYCIKADYGYSWEDSTDEDYLPSPANVVEYNLSYDLVTARAKVLSELMDDASRELIETLLDEENGKFNELLWVLDNIYIPGEEGIADKDAFLGKIQFPREYANKLTYDDIKAVQKAVIWYFTNPEDEKFDKRSASLWLNITKDGGTSYSQLAYSTNPRDEGEDRNAQANVLYNYLITEAEKNTDYVSPSTAPISAKSETVKTTRIADRYVIGPIVINKNNSLTYELNPLQVTDQKGNAIEFKYREQQDGTDVETLDLENINGNEISFYISIARNIVSEINITLTGNYLSTTKTLWLSSIEENNQTKLVGEQPLVEVKKEVKDLNLIFKSKPEEFDLALRKYITEVNGNPVSNTREPNIDKSTLNSDTTATYKHRKEPVVVKDHDKVTYQIAIYNEGNKAGYASKIIDQLPTGLVLSTEYNLNEPIQSNKNTYNLSYDTASNQIILTIAENQTIQSLNPYIVNNLDSEVIEIKCLVAEEADEVKQKVLTNIAWIDEAYEYDETQQKYIVSDNDRDSSPNSSPNVSQTNMPSYRGSTTGNELSDSNYFYKGLQDDDDFEKLVIEPEPKIFDLELVKFIAAVSDDAKIDEDEYLLDKNGLYERAPKISIVQEQDSEDRRIHCDWSPSNKNPLLVEEGDYVLYTIRVYNAGEQDGYAAEIKDHLPVGLVHVEPSNEDAEYFGIWNIERYEDANGDERQILSTDYLAKGKWAEEGAKEGETKYTANLLRALNTDPNVGVLDGETRNPDYRDVQVLCQVTSDAQKDGVLINFAQISKDTDKNGKEVDENGDDIIVDEDSTPGNLPETGPHEDDEDYEKIRQQHFDLSLRKFITSVDGKEITTRVPKVDTEPLVKGEDTAEYKHTKQPIEIQIGDEVIYTIRVYNEGTIDGYASKITDYLPPYLTYNKDSEINKTYKWQISDNGRIATTTYLENTELKAFDGGEDLDYAEVKIACIISKDAPAKQIQTNIAEISEYKYNGNVVSKDVDSTSNNMTIPSDDKLPSYKQDELNKEYVPGNEDDDDFEKIYVKSYDLSLRKFITSVDGKEISTREPKVDTAPLKNGENTAIYKHPKQPLAVKIGDNIVYTIRVYNEGKVDGIASEIKDYLPKYLKYDKDSEINKTYKWQISEDGRIATTTYLENTELKAFDGGEKLDYADVKIECIVAEDAPLKEVQTNIAEISEYTFNDIVFEKDIDSKSDNMTIPSDDKLPSYKQEELNKEYVPGNEDDDDFEKIYVKQFDLALRKFITKLKETEVTTREPKVDITPLTKGEDSAIYEHSKEALTVHVGDIVIYTIRVYNEGEISGYASEITDDIPEYLEYLPEDATNVKYMWKMYDKNGNETEKLEDAVSVKTTYLSKENEKTAGENLIKAFDGTTLDYKEVEVAFKVKDPNSNKHIITNCAQISEDTDENGNSVNDKDSDTEKWNEGEDDQDIENVKVEYFDLSILKFVSKVIIIEDGKQKISETGYDGHENPEPVVKVELHKKKLKDVIVKFGYGITVTNEGDIAGYATELTDYVPEGLKFEPKDNPNWKDEGNNVISTKQLEGKLLQPGESATVEVIFTWINGADNMGLKTNIVEISDDKNQYDVPDKDSTPDNKVDGEDDIDEAKVILNITTGAAKTYFMFTLGLLAVVLVGVALIKKFVL